MDNQALESYLSEDELLDEEEEDEADMSLLPQHVQNHIHHTLSHILRSRVLRFYFLRSL